MKDSPWAPVILTTLILLVGLLSYVAGRQLQIDPCPNQCGKMSKKCLKELQAERSNSQGLLLIPESDRVKLAEKCIDLGDKCLDTCGGTE
jgi:hypothetical protein